MVSFSLCWCCFFRLSCTSQGYSTLGGISADSASYSCSCLLVYRTLFTLDSIQIPFLTAKFSLCTVPEALGTMWVCSCSSHMLYWSRANAIWTAALLGSCQCLWPDSFFTIKFPTDHAGAVLLRAPNGCCLRFLSLLLLWDSRALFARLSLRIYLIALCSFLYNSYFLAFTLWGIIKFVRFNLFLMCDTNNYWTCTLFRLDSTENWKVTKSKKIQLAAAKMQW